MIIDKHKSKPDKGGLKVQLNKLAIVIACIHWGISFLTDRLVFHYQLFDFTDTVTSAKALLAWGAKFGFLLLLVTLWHGILYSLNECKARNKKLVSYLKYTGIYFAIMLLFFVILYPGLWRLDEFGILKNATFVLPNFWQGYLTSVFYIFALMLIPNPSGVVFVQICIISLMVGYVVYRCSEQIQSKKVVFFMYLPFLLFPVIDSNFYPMRMSIYAYIELLYAFLLFDFKYTKKELQKKHIWILAIIAGILVCWRTESIYYIVLAPISFVVLFWKETKRKIKVKFVLLVLLISSVLTGIQFLGNRVESSKEYELTSIVLPITPLVYEAYVNEENSLLDAVDKVLDTNVLVNGYLEGKSGISMYWNEELHLTRAYTDREFEEMKQAYYQLILKYPRVFMRERLDTFLSSTGLLGETQDMFGEATDANYVNFREKYQYSEPPFRSELIKILEFTNNEVIHNIIYSFFVQTVILLFTCLILLIKRKWGYFFICATVCAKIPLIFLTSPSKLFMYYYSIYLIGAVWITMLIVYKIENKRNERSI